MMIVKFPGIKKTIGGTEYIVPPINLRTLQQLQSEIENFSGGELTPAALNTAITVIHAALKRNYPEITLDEVGDLVDVGNMFELFETVMDVSGLKRKEAEAAALGESQPKQK
jgi:hypothetical protein